MDQVSGMTDKTRREAVDGREGTLQLAQKVCSFLRFLFSFALFFVLWLAFLPVCLRYLERFGLLFPLLLATDKTDHALFRILQVNELQTKIKSMTRKMMATVSELSMYQATAIKLEHERDGLSLTLTDAKARLEEGYPPTEDAEIEWCVFILSFFLSLLVCLLRCVCSFCVSCLMTCMRSSMCLY